MGKDDGDAKRIETNGWRQGSILPCEFVRRLIDEGQIPDVRLSRADVCKGFLRRLRQCWKLLSLRTRIAHSIETDSELWMVASQDCDLVQASFEKEPEVELVRMTVVPNEKRDGRLHWGDNPRTLQFCNPLSGPNQRLIESQVCDRARIDRHYLTDCGPGT